MHKGLKLFNVAPPYWRFLPKLLSNSLLYSLRKRDLKKNGYAQSLLIRNDYRKQT